MARWACSVGRSTHRRAARRRPAGRLAAGSRAGARRRRSRPATRSTHLVVVEVAGRGHHEVGRPVPVRRGTPAMSSRAMRLDRVARLPSTSRPSGWSGNSASCRARCGTRSSGASSFMRISSRITWRSASTSSGRNAGAHTHVGRAGRGRRPSSVGRQPRVERGVLLGGEGVHLAADGVDRLGDARGPMRSAVPLNSRCSRKCDAPASASGSSRDADADPEADRDRPGLGHRAR